MVKFQKEANLVTADVITLYPSISHGAGLEAIWKRFSERDSPKVPIGLVKTKSDFIVESVEMLEKLNWFCLTSLITLVLLMWKWVHLLLRRNHLLRCWGWLSLLNWIGALTLSLLLKLPPRKLEPWLVLWSFFLLKLLCISINLPYDHEWNTIVMSGLLLLVSTWNYWIRYKNGYAGLLILHLLPLLNPWLIVEMMQAEVHDARWQLDVIVDWVLNHGDCFLNLYF